MNSMEQNMHASCYQFKRERIMRSVVIGDFVRNDCFMIDGRVVLKYTFGRSVVNQNM